MVLNMKTLTKQLLNKNDSYIDALQESINIWKSAIDFEIKQNSIVAIGEIGNEIHKQNKLLKI